MATITQEHIAELLKPFGVPLTDAVLGQLSTYLDLLVKWNGKTNLTSIREPEQMVRRHFGESLFAASLLPENLKTVLDLGSGGGFPGVPLQILLPHIQVTLAESQGKKAAFLREVVRTLGLETEVWAERAEKLDRRFDIVAMRAVDKMDEMVPVASALGNKLLLLTTRSQIESLGLPLISMESIPDSINSVVGMFHVERT